MAQKKAKALYEDKQRMKMLREAFELFDLDGGGSIEANELHCLLEGLGIKVTEQEALDLVHEVDEDASGVIEFDEFVVLMQRFIGKEEDEVQKTWKLLDANGDGTITQDELCIALEACGMKLAPWELRDMMDQASS